MKVLGLDHIHLLVADLGKARDFAETVVGGQCSEPYGGEDWNLWATYHQRGGLDIFQPIDMDKPIFGEKEQLGVYTLAFRVDDIDEAVDDAVSKGFRIVSRIGSEEAGYGKLLLQAQLERFFNTRIELCERGLPDDPLHCPVPDRVDHVELYVNDLAPAIELFTTVTECPFPEHIEDERLDALTTTNGLGVRLTAPRSAQSPVGRALRDEGQRVHAVSVVTENLDDGISSAERVGLRLVDKYACAGDRVAEFDSADFFSITVKLVERAAK